MSTLCHLRQDGVNEEEEPYVVMSKVASLSEEKKEYNSRDDWLDQSEEEEGRLQSSAQFLLKDTQNSD